MSDQKMAALKLANHIRSEIAWMRKEINVLVPDHGCRQAAQHILEDRDGPLGSCRVSVLLASIRGVGPAKAGVMCRKAQVVSTRRLRDLSERQVQSLRGELLVQANRFEKSRRERRN